MRGFIQQISVFLIGKKLKFRADAINFPRVYSIVSGLQKHLRTLQRALRTLTSVNLRLKLQLKTLFSILIKQSLDEVEQDIMSYQNRGLCYLPKPKAEADNTDTRF